MTMTAEQKVDERERVLDTPMNKQFTWSTDTTPVRDAIWNYYMEHDGKDTMATEAKMHPYLDMSNEEVAQHAEELLKK
ncbi:P8 family protein [Apilactobacillus apinorum]|uniref:Uncharacterized protein n=1 Tax=Apilactobacillus apinorum TaxID=1218495 RepID=A0ABP9ZH07_9LACO|nr:hypothetical protein [Apilactobacillus apinorum]KOY68291.1 uncharacterized protein RZ74_10900 [Apilactobacillus apinorum]CAI2688829.1 Putative uncharacterized protein [Apilactobacillus apinorum]